MSSEDYSSTVEGLAPGHFVVVIVDAATGIVTDEMGRWQIGSPKHFRKFSTVDAARSSFANAVISNAPMLEASIHDHRGCLEIDDREGALFVREK